MAAISLFAIESSAQEIDSLAMKKESANRRHKFLKHFFKIYHHIASFFLSLPINSFYPLYSSNSHISGFMVLLAVKPFYTHSLADKSLGEILVPFFRLNARFILSVILLLKMLNKPSINAYIFSQSPEKNGMNRQNI